MIKIGDNGCQFFKIACKQMNSIICESLSRCSRDKEKFYEHVLIFIVNIHMYPSDMYCQDCWLGCTCNENDRRVK